MLGLQTLRVRHLQGSFISWAEKLYMAQAALRRERRITKAATTDSRPQQHIQPTAAHCEAHREAVPAGRTL